MKMGQVIGMRNIFYLYIVAALIIGVADPAQYNYEKPRIKGVGYRNSTSELEKANWFYNQGEYDEAILAYDEAIRLDPEFAVAWSNKGVALKALGRTSEADAAFAKAKELENAA